MRVRSTAKQTSADDPLALARSAAGLAVAILTASPVSSPGMLVSADSGLRHDANIVVGCMLALVVLVATQDQAQDGELVDAATMAVTSRYRDFASAIEAANREERLASMLASVASRLISA